MTTLDQKELELRRAARAFARAERSQTGLSNAITELRVCAIAFAKQVAYARAIDDFDSDTEPCAFVPWGDAFEDTILR